jgi:hypothetical protein
MGRGARASNFDAAEHWCRLTRRLDRALFPAIVATGDIPFVMADPNHGVATNVALCDVAVGPPSRAWREVAAGRRALLSPTGDLPDSAGFLRAFAVTGQFQTCDGASGRPRNCRHSGVRAGSTRASWVAAFPIAPEICSKLA